MQNAEDIVHYVTVCDHWLLGGLYVLNMLQTKQGRSKGKSAVLDEHWDPEAVNHARAELKRAIEDQSDLWKIERQKEQERKEKEKDQKEAEAERAVAAGAAAGAGGAITVDSDSSDDDIQVLDGPSPKKVRARKSAGGSKATYSKRRR